MKNMDTNRETEKETACSTALRYVLVFLLVLCAVLLFGAVGSYSTATLRHTMRTVLRPLQSAILGELPAAEVVPNNSQEIVAIDGDRGLDAAAVVKQSFSQAARYVIHLQLAGGADQLITVTAPPGGLQFEVRDMTGDNVRNDLVLRPALVHWPLIVLLNDGHDHFTVAIASTLPSSLDSPSGASGARQIRETVALASSGSRPSPLTNIEQQFVTNLRKNFFPPIAQRVTNGTAHTSVSGRAPPAIAATIYI
jgi:hypothetical protein